jgi:hypothetical protein
MTRLRLEALETRDVPSATHIGVVRPSDSGSPVFSLDSNGNGVFDANDTVFSYGLNSDKFLVGDWNGSGYDKIGVVRPQANGTDVFSLDSNGNGVFDAGDQVFSFGLSSDTVLVGDWNGDGKAKIGVVRFDSNGTAVVSLDSNGDGVFDAGDQVFTFGQAGDKFIVGDWNGDGKAKVGVVRNDGFGGATVILDSNGKGAADPNNAVFPFGYYSDTFLVGDWNGDGKSKVGVVRPTASGVAQFSLDTNGNHTFDAGDQVFSFGLNTDTILTGKWKQPASPAGSTTPKPTPAPTPTQSSAPAPAPTPAPTSLIPSQATAYNITVVGTTYYGGANFLQNYPSFTPANNFTRAGVFVVTPTVTPSNLGANGTNPFEVALSTGTAGSSGAGVLEYATNTALHQLFGGNFGQSSAIDVAYVSADKGKGTIQVQQDTSPARISQLNTFVVSNSLYTGNAYQVIAGEIDIQFSNGGRHVSGTITLYGEGYIEAGTAAIKATFQGNAR